jgi:4-hydroxymandelate oxidase
VSALARRDFLTFLLASPLLGCRDRTTSAPAPLTSSPLDARVADALDHALAASPADALDVFDLEAGAKTKISRAHWGNLAGGSEDGRTVRRNAEMFEQLQIRARRLIDTSKVDTKVALLGRELPSPLLLAPLSGQDAYHGEGEVATATAAAKRGHGMTVSSLCSKPLADIAKAAGDPARLWFQIYPTDQLSVALELVKRAEQAGASALVFTADVPARGLRTAMIREARLDPGKCESCHAVHPTNPGARRDPRVFLRQFPLYEPLALDDVKAFFRPITLDFVAQVRAATKLPIGIKGVMTSEDARICADNGIDAIWVSNHGGRQENSGMATIEALPEVVGAAGKVPVILDGGIRRGTDIFKALALGAKAVAIGRPQAWGLGAFGAPGVERVLQLLDLELATTMQIVGTPTISAITPAALRR